MNDTKFMMNDVGLSVFHIWADLKKVKLDEVSIDAGDNIGVNATNVLRKSSFESPIGFKYLEDQNTIEMKKEKLNILLIYKCQPTSKNYCLVILEFQELLNGNFGNTCLFSMQILRSFLRRCFFSSWSFYNAIAK